MLRTMIDAQALPLLMWALVAESIVLVALLAYLLLQRLLLQRPVGEAFCRRMLELLQELTPTTGILGTVCGMIFSMRYAHDAAARELVLRGLGTALYTTAYGLVLLLTATLALYAYPWRPR